MTTRLFNILKSELIKKGFNEFVDENGRLIFFETDKQFTRKILSYDNDVKEIMDELFFEESLNDPIHDVNFKKMFLFRFLNREINRQTIEAFQYMLLSTFLSKKDYINQVYENMERYILKETINNQTNNQTSNQQDNSENITDNRSAYANLPQNNVQLDLNSYTMETADDNTVSRNKQTNSSSNQNTSNGETNNIGKNYNIDELVKASGLLDNVLNEFDKACFMQFF